MSKSQEPTEPASDATPIPSTPRPSTGPWDPFRYLIRTISPEQRAELLQLQVPILPQEEFMTTAELRKARRARLRTRRPMIVGAAALAIALVIWAIRWWATAPSADPAARQAPLMGTPPVAREVPRVAPPATPTSGASVSTSSAPSAPRGPITAPAPPVSGVQATSSNKPQRTEGNASPRAKPSAAPPALSISAASKPEAPDFEQPFNPQ
jgi:hypothetical protein